MGDPWRGRVAYDVRLDCATCGFHLAYLQRHAENGWVNVDPRPQPQPPNPLRFELQPGPHGPSYRGRCKCGSDHKIRREKLEAAMSAVAAAGLNRMPMKALPA